MTNQKILDKLEQLLKKQLDPTPFLLAGTQILFKFEEMYAHVKGLTRKLDVILTKCDDNAVKIAALQKEMRDLDPDFDNAIKANRSTEWLIAIGDPAVILIAITKGLPKNKCAICWANVLIWRGARKEQNLCD